MVMLLLLLLRGTVTMVMATMVELLALPLTPTSFFPTTLLGPGLGCLVVYTLALLLTLSTL